MRSIFLIQIEKNIKAASLTTYHTLEAVLMCSRKNTTSGTVSAIGDYYLVEFLIVTVESLVSAWARLEN